MQTDSLSSGCFSVERDDLADWCVPLLGDCLSFSYRTCLGDNEQLVGYFVKHHQRLWLGAVCGDRVRAGESRRMLVSLVKLCNLTEDAIDTIDNIVLDELTDVVVRRYRGSPAKTRAYSRVLIDAASVLTRSRLAA